jgi:hypothetical protein
MPKYKLLLGAALGRKWDEDEVLRPLEELSEDEIRAFQEYRHAVVEERSLDPLRVSGLSAMEERGPGGGGAQACGCLHEFGSVTNMHWVLLAELALHWTIIGTVGWQPRLPGGCPSC